MVNFFTFILILFLIFLILGIGFISRFVRIFTKQTGRQATNNQGRHYSGNNNQRQENSATSSKKIFTKEEGEYIDYEEVKDY